VIVAFFIEAGKLVHPWARMLSCRAATAVVGVAAPSAMDSVLLALQGDQTRPERR